MSCHAEQREASSEKMDGEPACWPDFALLRMTALRCPAGSPPTKNKTAADCSAAVTESLLRVETSGDVFADQLGHVKHADLRLAREDNLQGGVRIHHAAVLFVPPTGSSFFDPAIIADLPHLPHAVATHNRTP